MEKLLFLDVETTGLDEEDRVCELAYLQRGGPFVKQYFKPPLPIKVGAMAVSHITNKMVEDSPVFDEKWRKVLNDLNADGWILVAHNAPFDLKMLEKEGVTFDKVIDTKKLSHRADPDDNMESHRLQYLRYYYDVEMPEAIAHSAEGDVYVLEAVYDKLIEKIGGLTIEEQLEISAAPVLHKVMKFGKYKGSLVAAVAATDPDYLKWLRRNKVEQGETEDGWIYTIDHAFNS